jgi:alpha-beta hydrolase superfamily lysophospholipase
MPTNLATPAADPVRARPAAPATWLKPPTTPDATGHFASTDGTGLYCEWFAAATQRPRGAALVMHGYAEHCGRYHEVARTLTDAGLPTLAFDFRGHGRSEGQRGHVRRFRDYLDDLDAGLAELARRVRDAHGPERELPVLLCGHSNGSLIALRALADPTREPTAVAAAVLSSPFLGLKIKVPAVKGAVGRVAGVYAPALSLPNEINIDHLTHDPDKLAARRADTLCHGVATARWFTAALRAHDYVLRNAVRVAVPTLWLVAGGDQIADPVASRAVQARLLAPSEYHEFPDMHHEVFNEIERAGALALVTTFVEDVFARKTY